MDTASDNGATGESCDNDSTRSELEPKETHQPSSYVVPAKISTESRKSEVVSERMELFSALSEIAPTSLGQNSDVAPSNDLATILRRLESLDNETETTTSRFEHTVHVFNGIHVIATLSYFLFHPAAEVIN